MGSSGRNSTDAGDKPPLVAGLIGLGPRGQGLLGALPAGIELKWLCDEDPQLLARIGTGQPACARTDRTDLLLDDPELDALLIASPPAAQLDLAGRALAAGKHAFLDQPEALTAAGLAELESLGRRNGLAVACGNSFLHSSAVRAIKEIVDSGRIGELFFVSSTRIGSAGQGTATARYADQKHFAMLLHWLGELPQTVRAVDAEAGKPGGRPLIVLTLAFPSGLAANVELGERDGAPIGRTVLVGGERMAVYDESEDPAVSTLDHGVVHKAAEAGADYRVSYRIGDVVPVGPAGPEPLEQALEDFETAARGDGEVLADSRLAKNAARVVEAGVESLRRGGTEVPISAPRRLLRAQARRRMAIG
jgi:predicted dehydrogenase